MWLADGPFNGVLMNTDYRWNQRDLATAFDEFADVVHPYYDIVQQAIVDALPISNEPVRVVDLGAGSGRLTARILDRWPHVTVTVIDQSNPFLDLARERLAPYSERVEFLQHSFQDDWASEVTNGTRIAGCVSTSAIHHLLPEEKVALYTQIHSVLADGGLFLNGDETRPDDDDDYRTLLEQVSERHARLMSAGTFPPPLADALVAWKQRQIEGFDQPRQSGDDCHESVDAHLRHLRQAGFKTVRLLWQRDLWSLLMAVKSTG